MGELKTTKCHECKYYVTEQTDRPPEETIGICAKVHLPIFGNRICYFGEKKDADRNTER